MVASTSPRRRLHVRQDGFSTGDPLGWFRVEANFTRNGPVPFEPDIQYKPESLTPATEYVLPAAWTLVAWPLRARWFLLRGPMWPVSAGAWDRRE
jgi:hypothetical protein